jgi:hypothetical protein
LRWVIQVLTKRHERFVGQWNERRDQHLHQVHNLAETLHTLDDEMALDAKSLWSV